MAITKNKNLFGLVLVGGQSKRMHRDKAALQYQGRPQWLVCSELLSPFCERVFLSTRRKSTKYALPQIPDDKKYSDIGPLAGILSAMKKFPKAAWLVLACDLPFVTSKTLQALLKKRNSKKIATAFKSVYNDLPEPLCAVYEPQARAQLLKFLKQDIHCPRKILINSNVALLKLKDKKALENINHPEEYRSAVSQLQYKGKSR